jgi:hypothetical protein
MLSKHTKKIFGEYVWDSRAHRMNRRHGWCEVLFCDSFACFGVGYLKLHMVSTFWNVKDSRVHVWAVCDFITFNNVGHQSSNAQHWIQCLNLHWTQFNSISWAWLELNECLAWCLGHTRKSCAPKCVCVCVILGVIRVDEVAATQSRGITDKKTTDNLSCCLQDQVGLDPSFS